MTGMTSNQHKPDPKRINDTRVVAPYDGDLCCRLGEIDGPHEPDNRYCLGRV